MKRPGRTRGVFHWRLNRQAEPANMRTMWKSILLYALALMLAVFALEWLEFQYLARRFGLEIFAGILAIGFCGLGIWVGLRLTPVARPDRFERNDAALKSLGISDREYDVLVQLAAGASNKEIARTLGISPNTIKTHLARLFEKLDVSRRMQAVDKARQLDILPS
ncbi:MAG: LuxR C-terminal-related transcriptional regulator [Pseudomonadota bacterium]|nr:LuxR C-terminal-related transcriptional regulator [Pseudomonadota bacterium]